MKIKEEPALMIQIRFDSLEEKEKVLSFLNSMESKVIGYHRGKQYLLPLDAIYYIELIDKQTFIYTRNECYESPLWLYQMEEQLHEDFVRANKSTIFNMRHIQSLRADLGSRIMVFLDNGDQIQVSRTYAKEFKQRLGGD